MNIQGTQPDYRGKTSGAYALNVYFKSETCGTTINLGDITESTQERLNILIAEAQATIVSIDTQIMRYRRECREEDWFYRADQKRAVVKAFMDACKREYTRRTQKNLQSHRITEQLTAQAIEKTRQAEARRDQLRAEAEIEWAKSQRHAKHQTRLARISYLKNRSLYESLRAEIGEDAFNRLSDKAQAMAEAVVDAEEAALISKAEQQ